MAYLFLEKIILTNKIFLHFRHRYRQEHIQKQSITLSTKVHLVKALDCPVVMYGGESWTIKEADCRRIDAFELWC